LGDIYPLSREEAQVIIDLMNWLHRIGMLKHSEKEIQLKLETFIKDK